jgi:hypothetical protein
MSPPSKISKYISEYCVIKVAYNGHAAGQFITFCPNVCPINEQKVEIIILYLNREFSAWTNDE